MPYLSVNNTKIYYEDSEPDNNDKPVIVFAHGLLLNSHLYNHQVAYFKDKYRCIAFDFRDHGKSALSTSPYDMDTLAQDSFELITELGIDKCHFVGLSMGGFIGLRLGIHYPQVLQSLILLDTSADGEIEKVSTKTKVMLNLVKVVSVKLLSKQVLPLMFGKTFLTDKSRKEERKEWQQHIENNDKQAIIRSSKNVIERASVYKNIGHISVPTLIGVGDEDLTTPYQQAERMHFAIDGSKLVIFQGAGHLPPVEQPGQVNTALEKFLATFD